MDLVNMKLKPAARDLSTPSPAEPSSRPLYPWGLQINLDNDAVEALGLTTLPGVGKTLSLVARVDVTSVSEDEHMEGTKKRVQRRVSLQITDMALGPDASASKAAEVLYPSKSKGGGA